jgi:hypothetical protein
LFWTSDNISYPSPVSVFYVKSVKPKIASREPCELALFADLQRIFGFIFLIGMLLI